MKRRIAYWDNLKYLMIVFVVVGHFVLENNSGISSPFYKSLGTFIYLFHMPVFFFISGYFFRKKSALWNALTYLIYAVVTKLILYAGKWAAYLVAIKLLGKKTDFEPGTISFIWFNDIAWFLIVLAVFELLMFILDRVNVKVLLVITIITGCIMGYIDGIGFKSDVGDYFAWYRIFLMFPFFVVGKFLKEYDLVEKLRKRSGIRVLGGIVIVAVFACFVLNPQNISNLTALFSGRNSYDIIGELWGSTIITPNIMNKYGLFVRIAAYVLSFTMIMSWTVIIPDKKIPIITKCGGKTILIFMFHYWGVYFVNAMGWSSMIATRGGKVAFILIAVGWTLILSLIVYKVPDVIKLGISKIRTRK